MIDRIVKREEVVDVFKNGKFELFGLTETKLRGNRDVSWCRVMALALPMFKRLKGRRKV